MRMRTKRLPLLSALLIALVALGLAALPAGPARAEEPVKPEFYNWDLRVTFESGAAHAVVTTYSGIYDPPGILEWRASDVRCQERGTGQIRYQNGAAIFDGASFLRCEIPPGVVPSAEQCEATGGTFWFSAEGTFNPVTTSNPMMRASDDSFSFALPSNGTSARTRVQFPSHVYLSGAWPLDKAWNETLMGQYGALMVVATTEIPGLLENLDPSWEPVFQGVGMTEVGHRMYSPGATRQGKTNVVPIPYTPPPPFVDIGFNATTGAFFTGQLTAVEADPPGCTAK